MIEKTGLGAALGRLISQLPGARTLWGLTMWSVFVSTFLTETTSNTAALSTLAPLVISTALSVNVSPIPPLLAATFGCSCAFMLPVATPPNAIVYASGHVPITQMVKTGLVLNITTGLVIWGLLRILCPLLGMAGWS